MKMRNIKYFLSGFLYLIVLCFLVLRGEILRAQDSTYLKAFEQYNDAEELEIKAQQAYNLAELFYFDNDFPNAYIWYAKSFSNYQQLEMYSEAGNCLINMGVIHEIRGEFEKASDMYEKSFFAYRKESNAEGISMALNNMGILFFSTGDYESGYTYFKYSLLIEELIGNMPGIAYSLNNIGLVYRKMGLLDKSAYYYQQSLNIKKVYGDTMGLALTLINQGKVFEELGKFEKAMSNYQRSLKLNLAIVNSEGIAMAYNNIGSVFLLREEYDNAVEYFMLSLEYRYEIENTVGIVSSLNNLARALMQIGNYQEAENYLQEALLLAKEIEHVELLADIYLSSSELRFEEGNPSEAYSFLKLHYELKDSLLNKENTQRILELEAKYESDKKESYIKLQAAEIESKEAALRQERILRIAFIIAGILLLLIAFVMYRMYRLKLAVNKLLAEKNEQLEELNATKNKFFSIISHDLRNPFGALVSLSEMLHNEFNNLDDEQKLSVAKTLNDLSLNANELLENLLQWSLTQTGKLKPEFVSSCSGDLAKRVFEQLMPLAKEKNIDFKIEVLANETVLIDVKMIETVLRNLLNNALKFTAVKGSVQLKVRSEKTKVIFEIIDSGIGLSHKDQQKLFKIETDNKKIGQAENKGTGLGLILCKEFVEVNKGIIGLTSELGQGSAFYFSLPLHHE